MFRAPSTVAGLAPALTLALLLALVLAGCAPGRRSVEPVEPADCIRDFDPATDYFPDKSTVLDAVNFRLEYHRSYQVLTVDRPYPGGKPVSYLLLRCGTPAPALSGELAAAQRIEVPVRSLFSGSTTQLGMIAELDETDLVTGVAQPAGVSNPAVRARIAARAAVGYAPGGQVNVETVLGARPDVLVSGGLDDPSYPKLRAAGVPVLADAEWLETTPLGRAEWVKVFAALTGTERRAAQVYDAIRADYHRAVSRAAGAGPVAVLPGAMSQGSWSMPTGGGYTGRLIADAAGTYPWATTTGPQRLELNFESVYARAGRAPLWLVTSGWKTLTDVVAADNRYAELAAVRHGQVWSATGPGPAGDYWERGAARPDLILADLIAILHPQLARGHRFAFYRRVAA